jgi:lipopolysaccharide transport system ATP-binding protein
MSKTVIKVENISKQYRLGEIGTGTLSHDLNRWWAKVRGKEDPFLKIGETNDRTQKGNSDYVWALKDINFEVKQGEVLGIIGRNGAGKSTLLKILSKTTTPTTGSIKVKGRIASLLEVGTGFHPELSGRDNIFLNGAILGMSKQEIKSKFDEIVDFSGVERYLDTPVKRYSSGMYVRLAFAVAAHLEPDILIVDEVLAVGDAEFQKKCLGKMKDVSVNDGRTVLFVSHNMSAINSLCENLVLLNKGVVEDYGQTNNIIQKYLNVTSVIGNGIENFTNIANKPVYLKEAKVVSKTGTITSKINFQEELSLKLSIEVINPNPYYYAVIHLLNSNSEVIIFTAENDLKESTFKTNPIAGIFDFSIKYPAALLKPGKYSFTIKVVDEQSFKVIDEKIQAITFEIEDFSSIRARYNRYREIALVAPEIEWELKN